MKKAHLMSSVQCHGCGLVANLNQPTIMATEQDMIKSALEVHKSSGVICPEKKLVIIYANALVANSLIAPKTATNGNNSGSGLIVKGSG
jgi:hypothetical protein